MFSTTQTQAGSDPFQGENDAFYRIPVTALTGTMLGVIALAEIGFVLLSWFVYREMGWQTYHG